jgi:hypothetical protein
MLIGTVLRENVEDILGLDNIIIFFYKDLHDLHINSVIKVFL